VNNGKHLLALSFSAFGGAKRTFGKARMRDGSRFKVDQTNNSYIFPDVGLGALVVGARRVRDGMFMAAAKALANSSQRPW
jgi:malic enzyme